tara:strand:+ start:5298 stop:5765 length:468 start_codon:yes stop_codon:yes gene_type:complete
MLYQNISFYKKSLIFLVLVSVDLFSKYIVYEKIDLYEFIYITSFFDITHIHNFGVSFGLFSGFIPAFFLIIIGSSIVIFIFYLFVNAKNKLESWGLFIIICGGVANIVDRAVNGYVIDFLYFHINEYYWPAFNFADIYISIGIIMIILNMLKKIS